MLLKKRKPKPPSKIEVLKSEGNAFLLKKEFEKAISKYDEAIKIAPQKTETEKLFLTKLLSNKCACLLGLKKYQDGIPVAQQCMTLCPKWKKGHFRYMDCLKHIGGKEKELIQLIYNFWVTFKDDKDGNWPLTKTEEKWLTNFQAACKYFLQPDVIKRHFAHVVNENNINTYFIVDVHKRGHFTSINQGIYNVPKKSKLILLNGNYNEIVLFDKKEIEIIGEDYYRTVIESLKPVEGMDGTIYVKHSKILMKNITIKNKIKGANSCFSVVKSSLLLKNCTVSCKDGTAIFFREKSQIVLNKSKIKDSEVGTMNFGGGKLTLNESEVSFCNKYGLAARDGITLKMNDSVIHSCPQQALILMGDKSVLDMKDCVIKDNNTHPESKTAVLIAGRDCTVTRCKFMNNQFQGVQTKICNLLFTENEIGFNQIGMAIQTNSNVVIKNNKFIRNNFGIWITENNNGKAIIEENVFENNTLNVSKGPDDKDPECKNNKPKVKVIVYNNIVESRPKLPNLFKNKKKKSYYEPSVVVEPPKKVEEDEKTDIVVKEEEEEKKKKKKKIGDNKNKNEEIKVEENNEKKKVQEEKDIQKKTSWFNTFNILILIALLIPFYFLCKYIFDL